MTTATFTAPLVLRTIVGYCVEWHARYPTGIYGNDYSQQFTFLPGAFHASIGNGNDIKLTQDLDGKTVFARTSDGTLRIESDDVGLLVTADLIDSPQNRKLVRKIDSNQVRGWSHRFVSQFGRQSSTDGVKLMEFTQATLQELTLVINKVPRLKQRQTPIFLSGGPQGRKV